MAEAEGQSQYDKMSKIQATAISDMSSADSSLNSESKSTLAEAIITVRWAKPEHAELVLNTLSEQDAQRAKRARRRRDHQDCRCFHLYLSEDLWKALLDPASSSDAKTSDLATCTTPWLATADGAIYQVDVQLVDASFVRGCGAECHGQRHEGHEAPSGQA